MVYSNISSRFVRDANTNLVLLTIQQKKLISRSEIAKLTNLSYPTVSTIIKTLMDEGFVSESHVGEFVGGRKPMLIKFNPKARVIIGVDLSTSVSQAVLADLDGKFISEIITGGELGTEIDLSRNIKDVIERLQETTGFDWQKVVGIGVSYRGSIDIPNRLYYGPGKKEPLKLQDELEEYFDVPIVMEHNYNLAMLAEYTYGIAQGVDNSVFINVGSGISAGIMISGQIYHGFLGNAGEFGHIMVDSQGDICPECGRRGCLETFVSILNIIIHARKCGLEITQMDNKLQELKYIADLARKNEPVARSCFNRTAHYLSIGIIDIVNLLNPELVILGGQVIWVYPEIVKIITEEVMNESLLYSRKNLRIESANQIKQTFLMGAIALIQEQIYLPHNISIQYSTSGS